jgi:hypothetical protein
MRDCGPGPPAEKLICWSPALRRSPKRRIRLKAGFQRKTARHDSAQVAAKKMAVLWHSAILCLSCHLNSQGMDELRFTPFPGPLMVAKAVAQNGSFAGALVPQCFPTYSQGTRAGRCFLSSKKITKVARGSLAKHNQRQSACTSCLSCFHIWR